MVKIILLSGAVSSGKSSLCQGLEKDFRLSVLRTRDFLSKYTGVTSQDRLRLQGAGDALDIKTKGKWVLDQLIALVGKLRETQVMVVDCVRTAEQIDHVRHAFPLAVTHVHLTASSKELKKRYRKRYKKIKAPSYEKVRKNLTESRIEELRELADVVIDTERCTEHDVLVRAASYMSLYGSPDGGYVDVVVGGQFGSEGKGQIVGYISREYDLIVRVGGPNAGHKVFEEPKSFTFHHLPSGTRRSSAKLLLGPGMVINVRKLLEEIADCKVDKDRLSIDPGAIIITPQDIKREGGVKKKIGSTGQGVGEATARKITNRSKGVVSAKDVPVLRPYIRSAQTILSEAFAHNQRVLLEGTQGTGLSIHHGHYPYVTSRDTTVSGCLSEAGIAPSHLRRVIMVCRTYPIRVESPKRATSGPLSREINWREVSRRSGIDVKILNKSERTSTTNRKRRIGEFDWTLLQKSAFLNRPTDIALTFTDYLTKKNGDAKRFEQLTPDTIDLIEEIERVSQARVSLLTTGFNFRSIIDRRSW